MNGVIVLNKPKGKTSHDMVYLCRKLFHIKRVGHTGTLDPNATGVLPVCIGNATKAASYITDSKKRYRAQIIFGARTDTLDITGTVTQTGEISFTSEQLLSVVQGFVGQIEQIPPMYSAIKIDGKKLYELAREGKSVAREPRQVTIYSINVDDSMLDSGYAMLDIECSKGTYIRTLCDDIGERLGCFAHMGELVRTYSGGFDISQSHTVLELEELLDKGKLESALISTDDIFSSYDKLLLDKKETNKVKNGVPLIKSGLIEDKNYRLYDENGGCLCISKQIEGVLKMQISFWT